MAVKVGLEMYSVREYMRVDPLEALDRCVKAGYRYLELPLKAKTDERGRLYGKTAFQWKEQAKKSKAVITGGYVRDLSARNAGEYIDFYRELGAQRLVIYIDYFPDRKTLDEKCKIYNETGKRCNEAGLKLYYENHYHEYQRHNGRFIFDLLMEQTDPAYFSVSLNTYWLMRGLVNPLDVLRKHGARVGSLVQEDYPLDQVDKFNMWRFDRYHPIAQNIQYHSVLKGNEIENIHPVQCELFTEIGTGMLPLQPVIDFANEQGGIDYVFLKQDYTAMESEFDSVALSARNYRSVRGIVWD
jgi:sugar phosphate isomerase/epimerase